MRSATYLVMMTAALLLGCSKSEETTVLAPAQMAPQPAEPAPVASTPVPAAPVEAPAVQQPEVPPAAMSAAPQKAATAVIKETAPKPPAAAPVSEPAPSAPKADLAHGQQIYRQACAVCHDKGLAGAPKLGDAAVWSARLAQGMDVLNASALRGKGAMPAKGGNPSLADADVKAAVEFIAAQSR